ncbi:MAG TPA: aminotransferase class IV [Jiangellaceae bacterium]|nr:aminotransferase class IV [Jiangellaceae bacterium]
MSDAVKRADYGSGAAFVDGEFVPVADARIPILDWGFLRSDATYDVAHVWKGSFFRLDDHLDRFERGMQRLHMALPYDRAQIRDVLMQCTQLSGLRDAYAEIICTRGVPPPGTRDPRDCTNRFYAFVIPFVWIADLEHQKRGLHLVIARTKRISPDAVDPTVKNYHWLDLVSGLFEAYDRGGETVALVDDQDHVVEGPGFNIFTVTGGRICTPDHGVLQGITRKTIIELAGGLGIPLDRRPVGSDELRSADEVFVTSTAGGVMPVTTVDGIPVGAGRPGRVTETLRAAYWDLHSDPRLTTRVRYGEADEIPRS